jgi:chromosomal replication initiator protein
MIPSIRKSEASHAELIKNRMEKIIQIVCEDFGVSPEHVKDISQKRKYVVPRQIIEFIAVKKLRYSLMDAAEILGRTRNHTTIINSIQTVKDMCDTNEDYKEKLHKIIEII